MSNAVRPTKIRLDCSTICQLRCPTCPTAEGKIAKTLKSGFLTFSRFQQLMERSPWISTVELSNWGEIFLNPDLIHIIRYAYQQGIALEAGNGVNLNHVDKEVLEGLARYRFRYLNCSIDGATQEIYQIYRRRGNLDAVLENIRQINAFKEKHRSPFPELQWQFVAHGHNQHEIQPAKELAKQLGMRFYLKLQWGDLYGEAFSPLKDPEQIREMHPAGVATREELDELQDARYTDHICAGLWTKPQVNFDGKVLGCCVNFWGDFGWVESEDILSAINNEKMSYAREMLTGKAPPREDIPCTTCSIYSQMAKSGRWIKSPRQDIDTKVIRGRLKNKMINLLAWGPIWSTAKRFSTTWRNVPKIAEHLLA